MNLSIEFLWIFYIIFGSFCLFFINFFEKNLRCHIVYQFFSVIISTIPLIFNKDLNIMSFQFSVVLFLLLIFAFIDIKYYELSKYHYIILLLNSLMAFGFSIYSNTFIMHLISLFIMYVTFFIFDKFVGIEKLGGADVKVMLSLALYFSATDVLFFMMLTFFISGIIFIIERLVRKTFCDLQVPMIVSIALGFFLTEYSNFFIF